MSEEDEEFRKKALGNLENGVLAFLHLSLCSDVRKWKSLERKTESHARA